MTSDLLYMTSHPRFMRSHPLYLWHHSHYISNITPTMFVNTYQLYFTWNTLCEDNTTTIYDITLFRSVSVGSLPLYWWYNTHSIYDITSTVYMAKYALYMTSHPRFMTSQHSTHEIKAIVSHLKTIISDSTSTVSLSSFPDYRSYNPHCMTQYVWHNMTQPQYVWHHMNYIWHHIHSIWYHSTPWHHTHSIYVITPRIPVIASTVVDHNL